MAECQLCGANPAKDSKIALERVNEKGVPGIWHCAYGSGCSAWEDLRPKEKVQ